MSGNTSAITSSSTNTQLEASHCWNHNNYQKTGQEEEEKWSRKQVPVASLFIRNKLKAGKENLATLWACVVLGRYLPPHSWAPVQRSKYLLTGGNRRSWTGGYFQGPLPTSSRDAKPTRALPAFLLQRMLVLNTMNMSPSIPVIPEACSLPGAFTKIVFTFFLWKRESVI